MLVVDLPQQRPELLEPGTPQCIELLYNALQASTDMLAGVVSAACCTAVSGSGMGKL